jgi:hypothetical protein
MISSFVSKLLVVLMYVALCLFPEHSAGASLVTYGGTKGAAALRKKATTTTPLAVARDAVRTPVKVVKPVSVQIVIRSTSYSADEKNKDGAISADTDSAAFVSKTGVPLVYYVPGKIGTAAIAGNHVAEYGDLIVTPKGECFLAVDTGSALKKKKASRELAALRHIKNPVYSEAPVVDFFSPGNKQVGGEWGTVTIIKCPVDFMSLKVSQRKAYLDPSRWYKALAQCAPHAITQSKLLVASR